MIQLHICGKCRTADNTRDDNEVTQTTVIPGSTTQENVAVDGYKVIKLFYNTARSRTEPRSFLVPSPRASSPPDIFTQTHTRPPATQQSGVSLFWPAVPSSPTPCHPLALRSSRIKFSIPHPTSRSHPPSLLSKNPGSRSILPSNLVHHAWNAFNGTVSPLPHEVRKS
jgi:hypothetical protein